MVVDAVVLSKVAISSSVGMVFDVALQVNPSYDRTATPLGLVLLVARYSQDLHTEA
jgi:hypothetical protein